MKIEAAIAKLLVQNALTDSLDGYEVYYQSRIDAAIAEAAVAGHSKIGVQVPVETNEMGYRLLCISRSLEERGFKVAAFGIVHGDIILEINWS